MPATTVADAAHISTGSENSQDIALEAVPELEQAAQPRQRVLDRVLHVRAAEDAAGELRVARPAHPVAEAPVDGAGLVAVRGVRDVEAMAAPQGAARAHRQQPTL